MLDAGSKQGGICSVQGSDPCKPPPPGAPLHHGGPPGAASSPGSGTQRWKPHDPNGLGATLNVKAAEKEI